MAIRGISETLYYVYNPLPDIDEAEVLERAKLDGIEPKAVHPFGVLWQYGGTLEQEKVSLKPGEFFPLRKSEADAFLKEFGPLGIVAVEDPHNPDEVRKATLSGLNKALEYWRARGNKRITEYRKTHGIGADELEDFRYDLWAYYYNQARADIIKDKITDIRTAPKAS